ncbi:MAG: APA family basic amino acid/polyamine antiporter [Kiritimatiellia bacterium]|jgi:APA family basic amino acid/polyamine antiporter
MTSSPTLRRSLNLPLVILYGLGNILGAGIYVLIGKVAGAAGYLAPFSFLVASIIAGITAFSFCELSSRFPVSAGEAVYIKEGFRNPRLSLAVGLLIILTGIVSAATMTKGFVGYLNVFIELPPELVIVSLLALLGAVAVWGIAESVSIAAAFTVLEIVGLLLVLFVTMPALEQLPARKDEFIPTTDLTVWTGVFGGAFLAFYAYVGFEDMVNLAEEVKNSRRNLPIAILLALAIATTIYVLVALSSVLVLTPEQLQLSESPLADIYRAATNQNPWFISMVSLCAVINGALIQIIMGSRVAYGLAKQGLVSEVLAKVNPHTQTPVLSTGVITGLIIIAALWLPIETLARTTSYLLLVLFCMVNLALIRIKRRDTERLTTFTVPMYIPYAGFTSCALFLGLQTWSVLSKMIGP